MKIFKSKPERERAKMLKAARRNPNPQTYDASKHRSWGNSIQVSFFNQNTGEGRVVGWQNRHPKEGDFLVVPSSKDGVSMRFIMFNIKGMMDPRDMFSGDIQFVDHVDTAGVKENLHRSNSDWIS